MKNKNRPSKDEYYLGIAQAVCKRSPCIRRQYGAIVVKDDVIISTGYNGPPRGVVNCTEVGCLKEEMNLPHYGKYDYCLPPDEEILTNEGYKSISKIKAGDKVLSHQGDFEIVTKTFSRTSDQMFQIKPTGLLPVKLTPNHPVLATKTDECRYNSHIICKKTCSWDHRNHCPRYFEDYELEWIPSKNLETGDIVVLPFNNKVEDKEKINLSFVTDTPKIYSETINSINSGKTYTWIEENLGVKRTTAFQWSKGSTPRGHTTVKEGALAHGHSLAKSIPSDASINKTTLRLFGFYLAEGCSSGNQVTFTFNTSEDEYVEEVKQTMKNEFGLDCYTNINRDRHNIKLKFSSVILAEIFGKLFGKKCYTKRIPKKLMILPPSKQKHILEAYAEGDGHLTKEGETRVKTASKTLALQVIQILLRLNIIPIIDVSENNHGTQIYRVIWKENKKREHRYIEDNLLFAPITEIQKEKYSGSVYNLEVSNSNSYTTKSFAVHNCIAIHAEENAVINAARHGASVLGGTLYLYGQEFETGKVFEGKPCDRCKRTLINAGIEELVTKRADGTILKKNVSEWVSRDTEKYLENLEEAKENQQD